MSESKIVTGEITQWTKPLQSKDLTSNFIKLVIDNVYYTIFADKDDKNPQQTMANMVLNIPAGSKVEFMAKMGEYQGKPQGTVVPKTMRILAMGKKKTAETTQQMLENTTGRKTESEETLGKVRHGVACAFISQGVPINPGLVKEMENWVNYIISGKLPESDPLPEKKEIVEEKVEEEEIEY